MVFWEYSLSYSLLGNNSIPEGSYPPGFLFFYPSLARSILYLKRRTLLGPTLPAIIEARSRNVGMPQPLLHFGDVRVVRQCIGGGCGTLGMDAEAVHICIDAYHSTVMLHNVVVDRIRMQMLSEDLGNVVLHRPEERTVKIILVLGSIHILRDEALRFQTHRDVAYLLAFAMH